jgi:hypothetical protein
MIIAKELDGKIYLSMVGYTNQPTEWYYVGPGLKPKINWAGGTEYVLHFSYLSSTFARVLDSTVWPPTQVDPLYAGGGQLGFQTIDKMEVGLTYYSKGSFSSGSWDYPYFPVPIKRNINLFYDLDTGLYKTYITRDTSTPPGSLGAYRVYTRDIGTQNWESISDWISEIDQVEISGNPLCKEITASWGTYWVEGYQNQPLGFHYQELDLGRGSILTVNSNIESKTFSFGLEVNPQIFSQKSNGNFDKMGNVSRFLNTDCNIESLLALEGSESLDFFMPNSSFIFEGGSMEEVSLSGLQICNSALGF